MERDRQCAFPGCSRPPVACDAHHLVHWADGGGVREVALVSAGQFLPFAVLALPAGVWADRHDRKRILITSDLVRLVAQLIGGSLLVTGHATVPALAVLAAVYGAADAFFAPAFTGLLPRRSPR